MAAGYLLDTNILSAIMRGEPRALLNKLAGIATERLHLSALVLGELATGAEKGTRKVDTLARLRELGEGMTLIPFDGEDAMTYGRIRAALERKGEMPGQLDCLIAAQAVARGLVLVTDNLREFQRVPGLHCENWLRAPKPTKESSKSR